MSEQTEQPQPAPPPYDTNSPLASWAGPYVTDMLARSWALSQGPYQAYQGPLTAGASQNQINAFQGVAGLAVPDVVGQSATNLQNIGTELADLSFDPATFASQYAAPTNMYQAGDISYDARDYDSQYTAPTDMYQAGDISYDARDYASQYTAPADIYQAGDISYDARDYSSQYASPTDRYQAGEIGTERFDTAAAQRYMNPYLQTALDPMLQEARRQAEISRLNDASRLTQAGAFGGSRQAIMESEMNRNLMDKQNQMLTQGYQTAFNTAMQGFQTDEQRVLDAQIAQERAREAQGSQSLTDAESLARYGLAAEELGQKDRQTALDALIAQERAREAQGSQALTGAADAARYGLAADELGQRDRQSSLDALIAQERAREAQGSQALTGAADAARYGLAADELGQRDRQSTLEALIAQERAREAEGSQALTGAADAARYGLAADELGEKSRQFGAGYGLDALRSRIDAEREAGDMGLQGLASEMDIYNQMYDMGTAERGIDQERIAADYAQFQQERDDPYRQLQFMQSMLQGLPISSRETSIDQNILAQILGGAGGLGELFRELFPEDSDGATGSAGEEGETQ